MSQQRSFHQVIAGTDVIDVPIYIHRLRKTGWSLTIHGSTVSFMDEPYGGHFAALAVACRCLLDAVDGDDVFLRSLFNPTATCVAGDGQNIIEVQLPGTPYNDRLRLSLPIHSRIKPGEIFKLSDRPFSTDSSLAAGVYERAYSVWKDLVRSKMANVWRSDVEELMNKHKPNVVQLGLDF